jgi:ribosome biogenesis GTPase
MIDIDPIEPLRRIGLTAAALQHLHRQLDALPSREPPLRLMRLIEVQRETLRLHDGRAEVAARALPRLVRRLDEAGEALAVGDWVLAAGDAHGEVWLHERLAPLTHLARRDADGRRHALVSNVDTALVVMGLDADFNPRRLERYLALVHASGIAALLVLSKADAAGPGATARSLEALRERLPSRIDRVAVDARSPEAARSLEPWLGAGQTLVVLGSSGAGKSTLINTLLGAARQDTGAVRASDGRGMHTTTARSLHRLSGGACIIDTPGLRALRPDADAAAVAASFEDIESLALHCRFRDCAHRDEPGCAVREAVAPDRLRNSTSCCARRDATRAPRSNGSARWRCGRRAAARRGRGSRPSAAKESLPSAAVRARRRRSPCRTRCARCREPRGARSR